jgi:hypothetical protein
MIITRNIGAKKYGMRVVSASTGGMMSPAKIEKKQMRNKVTILLSIGRRFLVGCFFAFSFWVVVRSP